MKNLFTLQLKACFTGFFMLLLSMAVTAGSYGKVVHGKKHSGSYSLAPCTPPPVPVIRLNPSYAAGSQVTLQPAAVSQPSSITYKFYASIQDTIPVFVGQSYTTPSLGGSATYYVQSLDTLSGCASSLVTVPIVIKSVFNLSCDYANSQINDISNGIPTTPGQQAAPNCVGCSIMNPEASVDQDSTNFTTLSIGAGAISGYVEQTLIFPKLSEKGDVVQLKLEFPASNINPNANLFGSIVITTFNNGVSNNDSQTLAAPLAYNFSTPQGRFVLNFTPQKPFNGFQVRYVASPANANTSLRIYYASREVDTPLPPLTAFICAGQTAQLAVPGPDANATYQWFTSYTANVPVYTGTSITTPALAVSTVYYVQSVRTSTGCVNPNRSSVTVVVTPYPSMPTSSAVSVKTCTGQPVVLSATVRSGNTVSWYNAPSGGILLYKGNPYKLDSLNKTTVFYASASNANHCISSGRLAITVTVSAPAQAPVLVAATTVICSGQQAKIAVKPVSGATFNWYAGAAGGNMLFSGPVFTTPVLTSSVSYYVEAVDSLSACMTPSKRIAAPVTVNAAPASPVVAMDTVSVCYGNKATFTASSSNTSDQFTWYATASSTAVLASGASFTTPVLNSSATYYVSASNAGGCTSASRTKVTALVSPLLVTPLVTSADTSVCAGNSATLQASSSNVNSTVNWYTAPSGGKLLFTGNPYRTGPLTATTTFYAESENGTCSSPSRGMITIKVGKATSSPVVSNPAQTICSGSTATLTVNALQGIVYKWYSSSTLNVLLYTGAVFVTPAQMNSHSYYVTATDPSSNCRQQSAPAADSITVETVTPAATVSKPGLTCAGSTATITATSPLAGTVFNWYSTATGSPVIFTGSTFTTPGLAVTTTYYVQAVSPGRCPATPAAATVAVEAPLLTPVVSVITPALPLSISFHWVAIAGAKGYDLSTDLGKTFISVDSTVTTYTFSHLRQGDSIILRVRATGRLSCSNSVFSVPVTGKTSPPPPPAALRLYIPNAFTPNNDGRNDVFLIYGTLGSYKFSVFNQWGQLIFYSTNQAAGWDGTFHGQPQPVGVYVYLLDAADAQGRPVLRKGSITLLR